MKLLEEYKDLQASVEYKFEKGSVQCDFIAKSIVGFSKGKNGEYDVAFYEDEKQKECSFEQAENLIRGSVKWDFCGHYRFGNEDGYLHVCGENNADQLAELIVKIKNRCMEIMKENGVYTL